MAALDELVSLTSKAHVLYGKRHFERSLEKWRAALAAAEALGAEDCVLVALFKTEVAHALYDRELAQRRIPYTQAVAQEVLELQTASVATLRRRREAGTLMAGKCRPIEVQWALKCFECGWSADDIRRAGAQLQAFAELVGYDAFLNACYSCVKRLGIAILDGTFERGGETERTFLSLVCDLIDEAVALMMQPRVLNDYTSMEASMLNGLPLMLDALTRLPPSEAGWHERVSRAHVRLRQSGVLKKRGLEKDEAARVQARMRESMERSIQERTAAAASGQLRSCALASCGAREAHVSHFGKCSSCKTVAYCCRDHQQADWPAHKAACKAARKAAAATKDAA